MRMKYTLATLLSITFMAVASLAFAADDTLIDATFFNKDGNALANGIITNNTADFPTATNAFSVCTSDLPLSVDVHAQTDPGGIGVADGSAFNLTIGFAGTGTGVVYNLVTTPCSPGSACPEITNINTPELSGSPATHTVTVTLTGDTSYNTTSATGTMEILECSGSGEISTGDLPVDSSLPSGYFLYVANEGDGGGGTTVVQISDIGTATVVGNGFNGPSGLAEDTTAADPLLFVSDDNNGIYTQSLADVFSTLGTGFTNPNALYYDDGSNDLYIAEAGSQIVKLDLDTMGQTVLATGYSIPQAVVRNDTSGIIYFTDASGDVCQIDPSDTLPLDAVSSPATVLAAGVVPNTSGGMVMDMAGTYLYVSDYDQGKVFEVATSDGSVTEIVDFSDFAARGLTLSSDGNTLYITGYLSDEIVAYDLTSNTATLFADNTSTGGLLNGPFGMVMSTNDYPDFDDGGEEGAADLIIQSITGPATACVGDSLGTGITMVIKNIGSGATIATDGYFHTDLVLSGNSIFGDADDALLIGGRDQVTSALNAGDTLTVSLAGSNQIPGSTAPGTYYLIGMVDSVSSHVAESDESNNVSFYHPIVINDCGGTPGTGIGLIYSDVANTQAAWMWDGQNPRAAISHADMGLVPEDNVDGLSLGDDALVFVDARFDFFSVASSSVGISGDVASRAASSGINVQRDLYVEDRSGSNLVCMADLVVQSGGSNGAGDVVDAFDFGVHGLLAGDRIYFSLAAGSPTLTANGWSGGDVLVVSYQTSGSLQRYVAAVDLGNPAEIDGLSIHDHSFDTTYNGATDYVIYSEAGAYEVMHYGYDAPGSPGGMAHTHSGFGLKNTDDIVALEHIIIPCCGDFKGDPNGDGPLGLKDAIWILQILTGMTPQ